MPRLSIIIPHRNNDERLEATVLSVLENRPHDSEIIVVHNGGYSDPYDLAEELLVVEAERRANGLQLLNVGVMAACAPVVCTLLDGVTVSDDWAAEPLELLRSADNAVVSVGVQPVHARGFTYGISTRALKNGGDLQRGKVELEGASGACSGPLLACGFYRKKLLRSLGGWNDRLDVSVADIELAWMLQALGISVECAASSQVTIVSECSRGFTTTSMKQLAELAVAYEVTSGGATSAMGDLLRGCLAGSVSLAVAWASGIISSRATDEVKRRLAAAAENIEADSQPQLKVFERGDDYTELQRRAA